ncbi:hypothetical protein BDB01DRAFT_810943 [Pilobolus umbonatus]|nr:hypothetical protein BDB01DRAFT_810943 [Pilobolus umbonatus]
MTTCSGNDYIVVIYIDEDTLTTKRLHEKDESGRDNHPAIHRKTTCIVNKNLKILAVGFLNTITDNHSFKDVDDDSVFLIDNIIIEYYKALDKRVHDRNEKDIFIISVFPAYIEYTLNDIINYWEAAENVYEGGSQKIDFHWVFTVPDQWDAKYFDTIRSQLININVRSIDNLIIVHNSYSLIRHLQVSHYNHSFVNGEYCIVVLFKNDHNLMIYGYEIGPPVKGLRNVAAHTLKEINSIPMDYNIKEYLFETIFNGDKSQLGQYNITLESLAELCKKGIWNAYYRTFFKVALMNQHKLLRDVDQSFFNEKEYVMKSMTFDKLVDNMTISSDSYIAIKNCINEISRAHNSVRAIVVNDYRCISKKNSQSLVDLLDSIIPTEHHNFNVTENIIFSSGAAQIVQSQLKIENYLPQLKNVEALEVISKGNIMYIDINWKQNSVLFIDSSGKETFIKNASDTVENCYMKMLQLEKIKATQESPYSIKKTWFNFYKTEDSLNGTSEPDLLMKELRNIINASIKKLSTIQQYQTLIPRDQLKKMLIMYIECLHVHIIQHLLSKDIIDKNSSFITYFSIEKDILDKFLIDYEEVRTFFRETNTTRLSSHPMKLIHREQLSAVYCKDTIKCYNRVEDYLDYPQYMMQVQLYPTYIDLTLNVILSLKKDITLPNNETVLTIKRKRILYNMVDVMSELLWDYIQSREEFPVKTCHEHHHSDYEDNILMYIDFKTHFNNWFTNEVVPYIL